MSAKHVVQRERPRIGIARAAAGALAEHDTRQPVQHACQLQLLKHAVDPVGFFVDVFEKQDRPVEVRQPAGTHHGRKDGEIAAEQPAPRDPGDERAGGPTRGILGRRAAEHGRRARKGDPPQALPACAVPPARRIGAMERRKPSARGNRHVQRRRVAIPDQQFRIGANGRPVEQRQDPRPAPAATHREDRAHLRVGEHRIEIRGTVGVGPGQIAMLVAHMAGEFGNQPHAGDPVNGPVEFCGQCDRASRGDQADRISRPQPGRHGAGSRRQSRWHQCRSREPAEQAERAAPSDHVRLAGPKACGSRADSFTRTTSSAPTHRMSGSVPPSCASSLSTCRQRPQGVIGSAAGPVTATA